MMGFQEGMILEDLAGGTQRLKGGLPEECRIPMVSRSQNYTMKPSSTSSNAGLLETTLERLGTCQAKGLTLEQVLLKKQEHGPNELDQKGNKEPAKTSLGRLWNDHEDSIKNYLDQFQNPLILLLIGSATISLLLGQLDNAISIALVCTDLYEALS